MTMSRVLCFIARKDRATLEAKRRAVPLYGGQLPWGLLVWCDGVQFLRAGQEDRHGKA